MQRKLCFLLSIVFASLISVPLYGDFERDAAMRILECTMKNLTNIESTFKESLSLRDPVPMFYTKLEKYFDSERRDFGCSFPTHTQNLTWCRFNDRIDEYTFDLMFDYPAPHVAIRALFLIFFIQYDKISGNVAITTISAGGSDPDSDMWMFHRFAEREEMHKM